MREDLTKIVCSFMTYWKEKLEDGKSYEIEYLLVDEIITYLEKNNPNE